MIRTRTLLGAIPLAGALFLAGVAGGQTATVTDYANYPDTPQALLPAGCDGNGIFGATYTLDGSAPVDNMRDLPDFTAGATLTLTWTSTTPECVEAPVVLAMKDTTTPTFDAGVDQRLITPYALATADGGPGTVSFVLPDLIGYGNDCNYQVDAIVGLPLAIVGPSGSDYSSSVRGDERRTTIVEYTGYRNGRYAVCQAQETTTTTVPDTTVPPPATTVPPSDTPPTVPETTTIPATTVPPSSTTTPAITQADWGTVVAAPAPTHTFPVTGANTARAAAAGLVLAALGVAAVLITRKYNHQEEA